MVPDLDAAALQAALRRLRDTPKSSWSTPARAEWMDRNDRGKVCDEILGALAKLDD
jgi:hypothetical protein